MRCKRDDGTSQGIGSLLRSNPHNVCSHRCKTRPTHTLFRAKLLSLRCTYDMTVIACLSNILFSQVAKAELAKVRQTVLSSLFAMQTLDLFIFQAPIRARCCQYSRSRPGTLEEEICLLDSSSPHRRQRSCQRSLGQTDSYPST